MYSKIIKTLKRRLLSQSSSIKETHKVDVRNRPELYRIVKISHDIRMENLFILLSDDDHIATGTSACALDLPTDTQALNAIKAISNANNQPPPPYLLNELCVVVWI